MWSQWMMDSWGYGGYGPFHMIIWIILVIAIVAGVVWRVVKAQQKKAILNSFYSGTFAQHNSKGVPQFAPNFTVHVLPPDVVCLHSEDREFFLHVGWVFVS